MKLARLTERVWVYPFEEERDRPNLGYIKGDHWSLAVDAGHSAAHTAAFYRAIQEAGLPLPALTVLTHWHWDHTFGLHAVSGLSLAGRRTNDYLQEFQQRLKAEGNEMFFSMDERIRKEYMDGQAVIVKPADMTFEGEMRLDLGHCPVRVFWAPAPHTDDSTLIQAVEEKLLFLGDAACGSFPDWKKNPALCRKLASVIEDTGVEAVLEGHWTLMTRQEMVNDLLADGEEREEKNE